VLVTGASGFIGAALLRRLAQDPAVDCLGSSRRAGSSPSGTCRVVHVSELGPDTDWTAALDEVDSVVHTAARVHVMRETAADPLAEFRRANVEGTMALARQAAAAGVRRFIFLSSIKVNGEGTMPGRPYRADDVPAPADPYGVSKCEAEQALLAMGRLGTMSVTIIRPVLVYGPGVKGNFLSMMRWLGRGVPLPFGAIDNRRSLVAIGNLVDLIVTCLDQPGAANQIFLVSDGEDLSTTMLLRRLGAALGGPARLIPVPSALFAIAAAAAGKRGVANRLLGSLQVDAGPTRQALSWRPPVSVDEAMAATAKDFLDS
jgi:nucleoside-diphosphate-sugar epimerase